MDPAVALVQAYLQVNGYFTVVEYPVLEALRHEQTRTATDLDVLAFRFPNAGSTTRVGKRRRSVGNLASAPDPALGAPASQTDMIVGEVKQGRIRFNPAARDPLVIAAALRRFGCCASDHTADVVRRLLQQGSARTPEGHHVRMVAFGSGESTDRKTSYHVVTLERILAFLRGHLRDNWQYLAHAHLTQPALSLLALMEKLRKQPGETGS